MEDDGTRWIRRRCESLEKTHQILSDLQVIECSRFVKRGDIERLKVAAESIVDAVEQIELNYEYWNG